ncbi:MAG: hypothetical protein ABSC94_03475 [Polyangiaceae bacterium]
MPQVQPSKALYFPHPEFVSKAWVKRALLYWESMARLVSPRVPEPEDDREIRELAAAGLIENVSMGPLSDLRARGAPLFAERIEQLVRSHGDRVLRSMPSLGGLRGIPPGVLREEIEDHAHQFEARGCPLAARAIRAQPMPALGLCFIVAANVVARDRRFEPVTDDPIFDAITTYIDNVKFTKNRGHIAPTEGLVAAQLLIPTPSLDDVAPLPVKSLLEIRRKYAKQRQAFRSKVQEQSKAIAQLPSVEAVRDHLSFLAKEIKDDLDAAREAMKEANIRLGWSLLGVSAPASIAAGIAVAGASTPVLGSFSAAGSLALAVTRWFIEKRQEEQVPNQHYLLSIESAMGRRAHGLSDALGRFTRSFSGRHSEG